MTPAGGHGRTYLQLVATMLIWGGTWVAARVAVQEAPPLAVAVWRFLFAGLSLILLVLWAHRGLPRLGRGEALRVVALAASGIFLYNLCFVYGMQTVGAGRGALVVALNPVITLLAAAWLLGEGMNTAKAMGSALAFGGCLTVIGHGDPLAVFAGSVGQGEWLILGCALMWSIYTLVGRHVTRSLPPLVMTAYACGIGFLMLLAAALLTGPGQLLPRYPAATWAAIAFLGLLGTTLGFTLFSAAVRDIGAARASIFINLVPVAAVLQGAWLLDEKLDPSVLAGGALVILGVFLTQRPAYSPVPRMEASA